MATISEQKKKASGYTSRYLGILFSIHGQKRRTDLPEKVAKTLIEIPAQYIFGMKPCLRIVSGNAFEDRFKTVYPPCITCVQCIEGYHQCIGENSGGVTSTSFVRGCVATLLEN